MKRISVFLILTLIILTSMPAIAGNAPDFTLKDLKGKKVSLSSLLKDGPILIDFWATWCKSCLHELPLLDQIGDKYRSQGLQIVAISTDSPKTAAKVRPFVKSTGYDFIVLLDSKQEVRRLFGGTSTPYTVLISQEGEIVYSHLGYVPGDELKIEAKISDLFASKTGDSSESKVEHGE
jgi:cytochrome c biogenesis protein CcmG/thiol:disulfide interchange protein DsbE